MDELTRLRSVRDDVTPADAGTLARGRAALLTHIDGAGTRSGPGRAPAGRRTRVRRARWIGAGSLAAAGVAATLVVGNVIGVTPSVLPHGGADRAAAEVLDTAATKVRRSGDVVVAPGQYLEIATRAVYGAKRVDEQGAASYLASQDSRLYVPRDPHREWVWVREPERTVQTFGADSERAAAADGGSAGEYLHASGGAFYGDPADPSPADLAALPRDPGELLRHAYDASAGDGDRDAAAFDWIADTFRSGLAPADLRASLYEAAAHVPGVTKTEGEANLEGRTGTAIGRSRGGGDRQELIIDPSNGLLVGEREVVTGKAAASWAVPDGTAIGWTAVTTSVVDAAPAGAGQ